MKKIKIFTFLVLFSVLTSGYTKHIAVKYDDFNVIFNGELVVNKKDSPVLTLRSVPSGVVCSGKPQVTEVMFFNYINPVYNGVFGKSYLSCNDGTKLLANWKIKKMILDKANGSAEDAYGRKISFYVDKSEVSVSKKLEQYKKDLSQKPALSDYRTYIWTDTPPVLTKEESTPSKTTSAVAKKEENSSTKIIPVAAKKIEKPESKKNIVKKNEKAITKRTPAIVGNVEKSEVRDIPAVVKKEENSSTKIVPVSAKKEIKVEPKKASDVKNIEKPKDKEIPAVVKKEENVSQKESPKAVEADKKIVPVSSPNKPKINTEEKKNVHQAVDINLDVKKNQPISGPTPSASATSKEVVTMFNGNKHGDVTELKKFKTPIEISQDEKKIKAVSDSPAASAPPTVFSNKNPHLKFTFGYNVSNPAVKF